MRRRWISVRGLVVTAIFQVPAIERDHG